VRGKGGEEGRKGEREREWNKKMKKKKRGREEELWLILSQALNRSC